MIYSIFESQKIIVFFEEVYTIYFFSN